MIKRTLIIFALAAAVLLIPLAGLADSVWVVCQPNSYVNIRARASGRSDTVGYAGCGDEFETDGRKKAGFVHVYASIEGGEGWICAGYLVNEKPEFIGKKMTVSALGRVNARRTVNGKRRCWVRPGETVMVYWMAEWAVTDKGFIRSDFLTEVKENGG